MTNVQRGSAAPVAQPVCIMKAVAAYTLALILTMAGLCAGACVGPSRSGAPAPDVKESDPARSDPPAGQSIGILQTVDGPLVPSGAAEAVVSAGDISQHTWKDVQGRLIALADYNQQGVVIHMQRYNYSPGQGSLEITDYDGAGRIESRTVHVGGPKKLPWSVLHYDAEGVLRYITEYRRTRNRDGARARWREDFFEATAEGRPGRLLESRRRF